MKRFLPSASISVALAVAGLALSFRTAAPRAADLEPSAKAWTVDAVHSCVIFKLKHVGVSNFYGRFNEISGEVTFDEADPAKSSVKISIPASSVDTNNADRDTHLRSNDFLSAEEFTDITFASTKVAKTKDRWTVTGDLTLHGVTKSISAEVEKIGEGDTPMMGLRAGYEARFKIQGADYDLAVMKEQPKILGPEIELTIGLELEPSK
jgi:polyisoprenoid-binding protein YceI